MEIIPEIQERADKIQIEMQHVVDSVFKPSSGITYQDCMNVAIFVKIAELELKIEKKEKEFNSFLINISKSN